MRCGIHREDFQVTDRVCRRGNDRVVGEVVSVTVRVKFPDGMQAFKPMDLQAAPTPRAVAAPSRKRKSYDVVINYEHDFDYGGHQDEIGSLNKRFRSMDAAVTAAVEFYEEHGKDDTIEKDDVMSALRKDERVVGYTCNVCKYALCW